MSGISSMLRLPVAVGSVSCVVCVRAFLPACLLSLYEYYQSSHKAFLIHRQILLMGRLMTIYICVPRSCERHLHRIYHSYRAYDNIKLNLRETGFMEAGVD